MAEIWAKSNGVPLKIHVQHMLDYICSSGFSDVIKKISEKLKKLLKYAVFFHDLGKVSPSFQKKIENKNYPSQPEGLPMIRHNVLSLFFINKNKLKEICDNDESLFSTFLSSVAFHHWKKDEKEYLLSLNDNLVKGCEILNRDRNGNTNGELLACILKEHFKGFQIEGEKAEDLISFDRDLANHIQKGGNLISAGIIPPYTLYFLPERLKIKAEEKIDLNLWVFLSGFLMRLDHFTSFCEKENLNLEIEKGFPTLYLSKEMEKKFGESFWQKKILENSKDLKDKNIILIAPGNKGKGDGEDRDSKDLKLKDKNIILIAPTGTGKTEFSFLWAEGEKFFYTLPLRVATNQIFDRACGYFNKDSQSNDDPFINGNVGLLHSDADLYIIDKLEISKDPTWDGETPKIVEISRHFSLPVNISTGDQIFPSALKYPGYEKIYATLGYSKLIIDEVQAYDPRACAIVIKMIEDIVSLGGKFLLMTATLPEFVREELRNKNIKWAEIDLYKKIKDITRHKVELKGKDIDEDIDEIIKKAKEGKRILVVLNTVKKAEEVYQKIKNKIDNNASNIFLKLLHSRFPLNERKKIEKELKNEFKNPKPKNEKSPKILVATQVVEASLDIDADYLFTEIAPIDSLIQRMGRVMRRVDLMCGKVKGSNEEFKYENFYKDGEANVIVYFTSKKDNKKYLESGKGYVYEKDILILTLGILCGLENEIRKEEKKKKYSEILQEVLEKVEEKVKKIKPKPFQESEKNALVEKVYRYLDEKSSSYLQKFYETLRVLNAGYVSENMEEAHRIFREIYTIPVITSDKIHDIVDKINKATSITWLWFKKEIIAEYVINENMNKLKEWELRTLWEEIERQIEKEEKEKDRLKRYCEGIFVVKDKDV